MAGRHCPFVVRLVALGSTAEPEGMRRHSRVRKHTVILALLLAITACSVGTPQAHNSPAPTHSASPSPTADAARCARLAKRGFTPCPPLASQLKLPPTTIKNATNGAVDDATVQNWGRAFQLGQAYYYWVMDQNARDALTSGVLADQAASYNLFSPDLRDLDQAKQKGGVLLSRQFAMPITQAVAIPQSLGEVIQTHGLTAKPYGLAVRFQGPASHVIRLPDGHDESVASVGADRVVDAVAWGELRADQDLGEIWYEYGYYGCEEIRNVCQL
jgi:hypothetical protein